MSVFEKKTVLFLPAWYPNRTDKLAGNFVRSHALALSSSLDVRILSIAGDKNAKKLIEFTEIEDIVKTYIVYYKKPKAKNKVSLFYEGFLYSLAIFYGYYRYLSIHKRPYIFHVHVLVRAGMLPYLLSLFSNTNYYITEHWTRYLPEEASFKGSFRKIIAKQIVKRSKGLSAVSNQLLNSLNSYGLIHKNQVRISNVLRKDFIDFNLSDKTSVEIKHFLHVSVFNDKHKNVSGILRAFAKVQQVNKQFKLTLVGDGVDRPMMEMLARELGLQNTTFTGLLQTVKLVDIYKETDALVLFSNYENQPSVILEAYAMGVPVIGSNAGGIPELIMDGFGLLVEPGNLDELTTTICKFIDGDYSFDVEKMKAHSTKNYAAESVSHSIMNFYSNNRLF